MSSIVAENKQSKISQNISGELVEQVIYIFQNHLAPMVETAINGKIERAVQDTHNRSTNTDSLLTRAEFLTAMESMDKRFEDINRRFEDQNKYMEKRFEDVNRRFEDVNRRFDDVNKRFDDVNKRFDDLNKRFNFIQWLIGIGFVAIPLLGTLLQNILN